MTHHVDEGLLAEETYESCRATGTGYWLLSYSATLPGEGARRISVEMGSVTVEGRTMTISGTTEAHTYIRCLDIAHRAAMWNSDAPKNPLTHEEVVTRLHALAEWAKSGTSSRKLSHHGIAMNGSALVGGFPVCFGWSGTVNAVFAYEKHCDMWDLVRKPWDLPWEEPSQARKVVESAGLTVSPESWNGDRSMVVNLPMHDSVMAAFNVRDGDGSDRRGPLEGAPALPEGWR